MDRHGRIGPLEPGGIRPRGRRVIFLVHGFNNDSGEAGASFCALRHGLDGVLAEAGCDEARRRSVQELMWEFHWPGFVELTSLGSSWSRRPLEQAATAAAYSLQVVKARTWVAQELATYCYELGVAEVAFVAHSLGCRVVLETVKRLTSPRIQVSGMLLMAAAIPIHLLSRGAWLHGAVAGPGKRHCFYSWRDRILMWTFPGGQVLAGEAPRYLAPIAVGLTGAPRAAWLRPRNTRLGHGEYWSKAISPPGDVELGAVLAAMFAIQLDAHPSVRQLPASPVTSGVPPPDRPLRARGIQGADWLRDLCGGSA